MNPPSRFSPRTTRNLVPANRRKLWLTGSLLAAALSVAASPPPGQLLASQCFQCHGTNGRAVGGFESITGKSANDMYKKLLEMSTRRPEGIMDVQARAYSATQLKLIATYLASLPGEGSARAQR